MSRFTLLLSAFAFMLSCITPSAQAELVSVDDWMVGENYDTVGGLRISTVPGLENVAFAMSAYNTFDSTLAASIDLPDGVHVASVAEYLALPYTEYNQVTINSGISGGLTYHNRAGWNGYPTYLGTAKYFWAFSDSHLTNGFLHSGHYETRVYNDSINENTNNFAGFVLIGTGIGSGDLGNFRNSFSVASVDTPMISFSIGLVLLMLAQLKRKER